MNSTMKRGHRNSSRIPAALSARRSSLNAPRVTLHAAPATRHAPAAALGIDPGVELMLRVQRDEEGAFAELIKRYWTAIFGRFYRQLGDRQEAEDLAQDVFLRLYRARQRYQAQAKFTTWLFHIAQNVARNALRTRRRKPCIPMGTLTSPEMDGGPATRPMGRRSEETPSQPLERAETAVMVRSAVANLARRQRRALELFQFRDWSCGQIAARMDMSPKAARSLLYRARNQLRDCLTAYVEA